MMKKNLLFLLFTLLFYSCYSVDVDIASHNNYYFSSSSGSDTNDGKTPDSPYKTISSLEQISLESGDTIFLARGEKFEGTIKLQNLAGAVDAPIVVTSFGAGDQMPTIDAAGEVAGIYIENSSNIKVSGLRIIADGAGAKSDVDAKKAKMRCGVLYTITKDGEYSNITLDNLVVEDIFINEKGFIRNSHEIHTANGSGDYGWGIRFLNNKFKANLSNIVVQGCDVKNVAHSGIRFYAKNGSISDVKVFDCSVIEVGGPGMQMSGVHNGHLYNNIVDHSGSTNDTRKWGRGSGYWCFASQNIVVEHNRFTNANGPNDSAGAHIDYNNTDVTFQYNFSANNSGGFCEVLGNNNNCTYRYNVSVNDGQRQIGDQGAKIAGYSIVVSGYVGDVPQVGPFNTYIYNNTIFVAEGNTSHTKFSKSIDGLMITNNIFHIAGDSKATTTKNFAKGSKNIVFNNNLFLTDSSWSSSNHVKYSEPLYGDAKFKNAGGDKLEDYTPTNTKLIKDCGIVMTKLSGDEIGLYKGLEVKQDILGNEIVGRPDLGAIELK